MYNPIYKELALKSQGLFSFLSHNWIKRKMAPPCLLKVYLNLFILKREETVLAFNTNSALHIFSKMPDNGALSKDENEQKV